MMADVTMTYSSSREWVELWYEIGRKQEAAKQDLRSRLIEMGVKAAHPNDGWVKRDENGRANNIVFSNPLFRKEIHIGDTVALYTDVGDGKYAIAFCRVKEWIDNRFAPGDVHLRKYFLEQYD